jgi:tRNA dimethylallyltransferase
VAVRPPLLVIVGPTASGKTPLACALARELGAEIVSADSQQCYRGLDAGTAKPGAEERSAAPHHLLDVAEPEEQLDAARFVRLADSAIAEVDGRGKRVIVAGGTGLWIRALLRGLLDAPGASIGFRDQFRRDLEQDGLPALHARLAAVDPDAARAIRANDRVRIERALEVHALSGRRLSELQREHAFAEERYPARIVHLEPLREVLQDSIARRTRALFESGALERETQWLLDRCERVPSARKALKIIGYGEMADALAGRCTRDEALERVAARTRQYAKRQRTWFTKEYGAPGDAWPPDAARLCAEAGQWYEGASRR